MARLAVALASATALLLASLLPRAARASSAFDDPYDLPDAPRPPTLPELTHPDFEATLESTFGALVPADSSADSTYVNVQRISLEAPLARRRWFVGANYEFAGGGGAIGTNAFKLVSGNLELYGRTLWATRTGLAFGAGLGLMAPIASFEGGSPAERLATAGATLRPWDVSFLSSDNFGIRPFMDVRVLDGPLVVQFRQGLDASFGLTDGYRRMLAITGLYVGYRIGRLVSPGIEAFELYIIDAPVADRLRANLVIAPGLRVMTPYVQPALSAFTNIGSTLANRADHIWGFRVAITVVYDPTTKQIERGMKEPTD